MYVPPRLEMYLQILSLGGLGGSTFCFADITLSYGGETLCQEGRALEGAYGHEARAMKMPILCGEYQ